MNLCPCGTRIAGRYEVASRPLMGGMGIVYLCFGHQEQRPVALKTFKPEYLPDRAARDRFLREATTWVNLGKHPHIVRCHQVIHLGLEVYLVLELVAKEEGHPDASLRSWLVTGSALPAEQALLFVLQIARGMAHATKTIPGFVHRDLKPENVLVGKDKLPGMGVNRLRVTDFGLVRVLQKAASGVEVVEERTKEPRENFGRMQLTRGIAGTPLYMAPEQWRGEEVTLQTDIYALGCILYEMLTGQRAVEGDNLAAVERAHCQGQTRPLPRGLPAAVGEVVVRCLAVEPEARYTSWAESEEALTAVYARMTGQAVPKLALVEEMGRAEQVAAGWSYNEIGGSYLDIGKAEVAMGYFERARGIGQVEGERRLEAAGLNNLGLAYLHLGEARQAAGFHKQALAIHREVGDRHGESTALANMGQVFRNLGNVQQAIGFYEQAIAIARETGDWHSQGIALNELGLCYRDLGWMDQALKCHQQHLVIARQIGDRRGICYALINLGFCYQHLGRMDEAIHYRQQSLVIAREIGDRRGEALALGDLGSCLAQLGLMSEATRYYQRSLAISREIADQRIEGNVLSDLGGCLAQLGQLDRAANILQQALVIARETGNKEGEVSTLINLGACYDRLGKADEAVRSWRSALVVGEEIGYILGVAYTCINLALLLKKGGCLGEALPYAERAERLFVDIGHAQNAQQAQQLVAQIRAALR